MGKSRTKERILGAAVRLFNESGTAAVSTNHIAVEAGISPGNLYYHYRNKEEVIRAIWARVDDLWGEAYALPSGRTPTLEDMRSMVEETFAVIWDYRFFYRELSALARRDPELRLAYSKVYKRGLAGTESLLHSFIEAGVVEEVEDPLAVPRLAKVLMLVAEFWLPAAEITGETPERDLTREGVSLMMQVLAPYLTDEGTRELGRVGVGGIGERR